MAEAHYTDERSVQIVISLLKSYGIENLIVSPGTTNMTFVASVAHDSFFKLYSAPDERSAAYMACGMAAESGRPVVLSCTGATASRNYIPGLTEAFYRKLPVLAITSTQHIGRVGNLIPQVIDRSQCMRDIVTTSVYLPTVHDADDEWACIIAANRAISALFRHGGGPAHINLTTTYSSNFGIKELPSARMIRYYTLQDELPIIPADWRVAVFVGAHMRFTPEQTSALDRFCHHHDAVVFCDWTSNYHGEYRCDYSLVAVQQQIAFAENLPDLLIHIGEVSGAYDMYGVLQSAKRAWRVSPDGEIRDTFRKLSAVFEMPEREFFCRYAEGTARIKSGDYRNRCCARVAELRQCLENGDVLPFSNPWIANKLASALPLDAVVHLGILNTLRNWDTVGENCGQNGYSNTGGFGIDGALSSLLGGALASPDKLHFCVIGDLAFFYDMNVLGNAHIGSNIRILLVNNGNGTEFRNFCHPAYRFREEPAGNFIAAAGHYGCKSPDLIRHYAQDLGFEYLHAWDKDSFIEALPRFSSTDTTEKPMIFEVFTDSEQESDSLRTTRILKSENHQELRQFARNVIPSNVRKAILGILHGHRGSKE